MSPEIIDNMAFFLLLFFFSQTSATTPTAVVRISYISAPRWPPFCLLKYKYTVTRNYFQVLKFLSRFFFTSRELAAQITHVTYTYFCGQEFFADINFRELLFVVRLKSRKIVSRKFPAIRENLWPRSFPLKIFLKSNIQPPTVSGKMVSQGGSERAAGFEVTMVTSHWYRRRGENWQG